MLGVGMRERYGRHVGIIVNFGFEVPETLREVRPHVERAQEATLLSAWGRGAVERGEDKWLGDYAEGFVCRRQAG